MSAHATKKQKVDEMSVSPGAQSEDEGGGKGTVLLDGVTVRAECRSGQFTSDTTVQAPGHIQANLVMLPQKYAADFELFCSLNSSAYVHFILF
jgi:hypothetical protein